MTDNRYSGPPNLFDRLPLRSLAFYQRKEQDEAKMGDLKWMVDDVKTVITYFLNLYNTLPSLNGETIRLNGADIGTRLAIDFLDTASITWAITDDPVTGAVTVEGTASSGGTPAGSTTEIQYNNAGAFGADSGFTRTAAKVTISGDGTGTDGVLHVTSGDSVSQYIVLEEESGRPGEAYLTFKGSAAGDVADFGVVFTAGVPSSFVFNDVAGAPLVTINISTGVVTVKNLAGVGTRMVTANATGDLATAAIPAVVTPAALTKTDDTNVTLTLGGTPSTALLQAVSLTLGWTGTLADARIASAATWNAKQSSTLTDAHILVGNASNVATDVAVSGDVTISNTGAVTIGNDKVTYAKMQNVSATDKLLGRVTAGSGDVEEVTLDPDGTLAANSDDVVASQKAVKTYVDAQNVFSKSSSDQSTTSTSLADITSLGVAIAANQNLYIKCIIHYGASGTNGSRYAVTIPSGATMKIGYSGTATAAVSYGATSWLTASATEGATVGVVANAISIVVLEGWVYNGSTAGTVQIQGRSANVANTVTWYSGSMIKGDII